MSLDKRYSTPAESPLSHLLKYLDRSSDRSESLAPPPSPYPQQVEPSPVDSNGTETTLIDEDAQEDQLRSPDGPVDGELLSPDIEITSPQSEPPSAGSVRQLYVRDRNVC